MARTLKIFQGEDQVPVTDITDMVEWPDCEFGQRAYLGEGTLSAVRFRDEDGRTGNSALLPAGLTALSLAAHNVVTWTEGSNTMFRGRVSPKDYSRGAQVAGRAREVQISLDDYNKDLHNIVVHGYARPAETDKARVQGILASYLSGSPRRTTNLNGSNYVSSSNTVALPAHTYTRTNVLEVLTSIATAANKQFFVTIDGELFYDGNDSTVYASPLKISDRDTEVDNNLTWAPIWDVGPSSTEDGQQLLSGVWLFYAEDKYVRVTNPTVANLYSWWEDIIYDDTVTTAAQATVVANAILARRQYEERTYNVSIGPLGRAQWGSLKHGQLIQIKARAIPDADDQYVSRRITELRWTPSSDPESLFAHMTLDRPIKVNPYGPGQKPDTITPTAPPAELPDTAGAAIATWDFNTGTYPDYDNETGLIAAFLTLETNAANCPYGSTQCAYNTASHRGTGEIAVTAGTSYIFRAELRWLYDPSARDIWVDWYDAAHNAFDTTMLVTGAGHSTSTNYTESKTVTAPTGAAYAKIVFSPYSGIFVDNMSWSTVGTAADNPDFAFDYGECPHDSPHYLPSDYVECRLEALNAAIPTLLDDLGDVNADSPTDGDVLTFDSVSGEWVNEAPTTGTGSFLTKTGGEKHTISIVSNAGSALSIDLAIANVFEITLTANCAISATGFTAGEWCEGAVIVHQNATGGWAMSYASAFEIPSGGSSLPTTANTTSGFGFGSLDGGTTIYWWALGVGGAGGHAVPPAILLESGHAVPFTFDEILQTSDGNDFLWASE